MKDRQSLLRSIDTGDLETIIALDRSHTGHSRRGFFERRWQAMTREPTTFIGLAAEQQSIVIGFLFAHMLDGEFGVSAPAAVLDAVAVATEHHGQGVGSALMEGLIDEVRARGGREIRTQALWQQRGLPEFFDKSGFRLAPRLVLERNTADLTW